MKVLLTRLYRLKKSHLVYAILGISIALNIISFVILNEKFKNSDANPLHGVEDIQYKKYHPNDDVQKVRRFDSNRFGFGDELKQQDERNVESLDERLAKYNLLAGEKKLNSKKQLRNQNKAVPKQHNGNEKSYNHDAAKNYLKFKSKEFGGRDIDINKPLFRVVKDEENDRHNDPWNTYHHDSNPINSTDNESLRKKFLHVKIKGKETRNDIWLHSKVFEKSNKTIYNDGILEQMNYVPLSYVSRLESLGLVDQFHGTNDNNPELSIKMDDFLRNEFDRTVQRALSRKNHSVKSVHWNGLNKHPIPIMTKHMSVDQNRFIPKPDWTSLLKFINVFDASLTDVKSGRETFLKEKCPVTSCYITNSPDFSQFSHIVVLKDSMLPRTQKPKGQIWLNRILEAPVNTYVQSRTKNLINWTATYRWDSTIVTPYFKYATNSEIAKYKHVLDENVGNITRSSYPLANKTHLVAWFASNCLTDNKRYDYVTELKKYIPVDVYGDCGNLKCERVQERNCFDILSRKYKFYLSFENSNCDYYITEKFFLNALANNVVPVVMGARKEDYTRAAPPNSFIHVEDFPDAQSLAEYLLHLDRNDVSYSKYLAWKGGGGFVNTKFWCRVCALAQDDHRPSMWYDGFSDWWLHPGACRRERWNEKK